FLSAFEDLPTPSLERLSAKVAKVIGAESQRKPSSESDRIRLRRALPTLLGGSKVPQTLPVPRKLSIKRKGKRIVRSRGVVLAIWLHAVLLSVAWMTVVNMPSFRAAPLSLDLGWASQNIERNEQVPSADSKSSPVDANL